MIRKSNNRHMMRTALLVALALAFVAFAPWPADAADRDVEWGCYQNSAENNGVVGAVTLPTNYNETSLKWANSLVSGYTVSFTPPLIIDGDLIVASNKHVLRIDKSTGEIKKQSEELYLNVGYAMNPITYDKAENQLYIPILNGRVQCLDLKTLESKWISKEYQYTQTLSPITCKGGLVYTGIWEAEEEDGVFFCLDAKTGNEVWSYTPSVDGADAGDLKHGFYWAGAYVNDNYVVVGSDDGENNGFEEAGTEGAYPETAVAYSFDRRTGEVVDRITGVKGDIRSSVVYHGGFIYFATKGGCLYKARLGSDGKFSQVSHIQLKDRYGADTMMTASPVIHNGRIYLGAAGSKGQFSADGGHFFAVISDHATLSDSSLIYTTPISGYPQAAPLLSTVTEATDGKVRLYFTFNAFPGGIYCLEDSPASTATSHESAHLVYRPEKSMQQYCISPLCCDREGTVYYKNDSGNLMAIETNKAWLEGLSVTYDGEEIIWESPFDTGQLNYVLRAPGGAESVKIIPRIPEGSDGEGMTVTVKGENCSSSGINVPIDGEDPKAPVVVTKTIGDKSWTRTYDLSISSSSNNANLAGLVINESNTKPAIVDTETSKGCTKGVGYDPQFDSGIEEYVSKTYKGTKLFLNVWLQTEDDNATLRVLPLNNVGNSSPSKYMNADGTLKPAQNGRYPVYWVKGANSAEIEVEVTSPSGSATKKYHITLVRGANLDTGETPLTLTPPSVVLYTKGMEKSISVTASYDGADVTSQCTFESADPEVATVDASGLITAVAKGEANIWVNYEQGSVSRRTRVHVQVKDPKLDPPTSSLASGTYTYLPQIELLSNTGDADIRYNLAYDGEDPETPTTTTGTLYEGPIPLEGIEGQSRTVKIRAIACGKSYEKSNRTDFTYTIDLTEGIVLPENMVSPEVGSIYITEDQLSGFRALPNGTTYDQLTAMLNNVTMARVVLTPGSSGAGIDSSDPERPLAEAAVTWEGQDAYEYYPGDSQMQSFTVRGRVTLPEGIDSGGRALQVYIPVTVLAAQIKNPTASPAPGTYKTDKKVTLTSATSGAEIYYTISGASGTKKYLGPISLAGKAGERKSWTIKAYATKNGLYSDTVSFAYTVDRRTAPGKTTGLTSTVNASGKKIVNKWTATKKATKYKVGWRKAGGAWKYKVVKGRSCTLTGLTAGGCYEVRVAAMNDVGQGTFSASKYCLIGKTTLTLKAGKKSFTAKVNKVKKTTGCEIRYSLKSNMSGAKVMKTAKKSLTIKKLKPKKVYYVQAAPYKKTGGKIYMGQYIMKKIKTKK